MCDKQSLRSACTYAQSNQSLCLPLEYSMSVKLVIEHHLEFLSFKGGCTGSSESTLVKMPHVWKSRHCSFFKCLTHLCITSQIWDMRKGVEQDLFLFGLRFYIPINSYSHVETISSPGNSFAWASLTKR